MLELQTKVVLTDIEGTTTSISFVKDILFPYAQLHTKAYLQDTWSDAKTQQIVQQLFGLPQYAAFQTERNIASSIASAANAADFVNYLIDKDLKVGPLKTLQGLVWAKGYADGSIKGHVFPDVLPAFKRWQSAGIHIAIYSSGSVKAQRLLFGQTEQGDLLPFIQSHFDTEYGHKQVVDSYTSIATKLGMDCADILFLTDVILEAEAARSAGMQTAVLNRPGNAPLTDDDKAAFTVVDDFDALQLTLK